MRVYGTHRGGQRSLRTATSTAHYVWAINAHLGGLVGMNSGSILLSSANGKIDFSPTYAQLYGGLIGVNFGQQYLNSTSGEALAVPMISRNFRY